MYRDIDQKYPTCSFLLCRVLWIGEDPEMSPEQLLLWYSVEHAAEAPELLLAKEAVQNCIVLKMLWPRCFQTQTSRPHRTVVLLYHVAWYHCYTFPFCPVPTVLLPKFTVILILQLHNPQFFPQVFHCGVLLSFLFHSLSKLYCSMFFKPLQVYFPTLETEENWFCLRYCYPLY